MKLAVAYSDNEVETLGVTKSKNFGFSKEAEEMIFTMFTKNIYSNPIGSVVREITSNCFDAHKEANVNDPVIVKLTKENNEHYISFIDVGIGMSPERITKVYAQYFNSTKRNDNNQIGGFGIGGKTPLAYAESFFLITTFNGFKYTYSIRKGSKSPVLDQLGRVKTSDRNGTVIKIPVRSSDVYVFEREINRQLYYFDNVIFEGFSPTVKNDYRIIEGKTFKYRGRSYGQYAHICLGSVAYPIDYSVLEDENSNNFYQGDWNVPVAIKMEIGEINVTVSREAIDYTEDTKKLIKKKLKAVKAEMLEMLDAQHAKLDSLEEYYRMEDDAHNLILSEREDDTVNISCFSVHRLVMFNKLNALNIPSRAEVVHHFYDVSLSGKKKRRERTWDKSLKNIDTENVFLILPTDEMLRKKNAYMKHTFGHSYGLRRKQMAPSDVKYLIEKYTPKNSTASLKTIFKQFRELQSEVYKLVEKKTKKYSSVIVPDGFTTSKPKGYNPNFELPVTYDSRYGFSKEKLTLSSIEKSKATIYYGDLQDESEMQWASSNYINLFKPKSDSKFSFAYSDNAHPIKFIMVARSNVKYIAELKNTKPIAEFKKLLVRKRDSVMKFIKRKDFFERYNTLNALFINVKLFSTLDSDYAKTLDKFLALKKNYELIPQYSITVNSDSKLLVSLDIDPSAVKYSGSELFDEIEAKTAKNGMLHFVKINNDFNPNNKISGYSNEESENIMQLLKLAYVK